MSQRLLRVGTALVFALIGLTAVMMAVMIGYQMLYSARIHRGVRVWNVELGGLGRTEAQAALVGFFDGFSKVPWELHDGQQTWSVSPATLGIQINVQATVDAAFAIGRSHSLAFNLGEQLRSASKGVQVAPVVSYDEIAGRSYLSELSVEVYRPTQDAALTIQGLEIYETRPQVGRRLDIETTLAVLRQMAGHLTKREVSLVMEETLPRIIDAGIAHKQATAITSEPLTLFAESVLFADTVIDVNEPPPETPGPWQWSREELAAMLLVKELPVGEDGSVRLDVSLNQEILRERLTAVAQVVSRPSTDARFILNDDTRQLEVIAPGIDGLELDVEATIASINERMGVQRELGLVINRIPPKFNEGTTAEQLGISELIASSTSYFLGSSAGRRNNVQVAASKFHGIIIEPGQTFSFNEWLGEVSEEEGYDESLIIFGNETIPDVGGGVCQVSTTAYRVAFWAGFPITERWAHAYRVGYYEQGGHPVGMDATIYSPHVDLKFVNDLPNHLLIETYINLNADALVFKFYSTNDGRTVEMEGPVITDVIEHGEPIYKEDPELEPGEIKQVEWATDGLTSLITRIIRAGASGEIIQRKEFKSTFRPWDAVYLVGPGTEVPGQDVIGLDEG